MAGMMPTNKAGGLYATLGLLPTASAADVRAAYRELAVQLHPDKGGDPQAFQEIQSAYDTLSDTARRERYDRLRAKGEATDSRGGVEERFTQDFRSGRFAGGAQPGSSDSVRPRREGDGFGGIGLLGQIERNAAAEAEEQKTRGPEAVAERVVQMDHSEGFAAWLRNNARGMQSSVLTGDDLVSSGLIQTTGVLDVPLPELRAPAVMYDEHGAPADVLSLCAALPCRDRLEHGEVLVRMLAAPVNDEDLLRASTPLHALNCMPPFDQVDQQWAPVSFPAVAGVDGVGVVVATARRNSGGADVNGFPGNPAESPLGDKMVAPLEPKDWVVVKPVARAAPVGSWRGLLICQESRLCAVPPQLMPPTVLACSRALATAYRLLEDYGSLRPGDAIIQNAADEQVGLAVMQLCKLLRLTCISVLSDTPDFLVRSARLKQDYGAMHVIRDGPAMADAISAAGVPAPRLALDALGGESGRRLLRLLRAGSPLVCYALRSNRLPTLDVSLLLYHQISLHGFSLNQWVEENGSQAYVRLLEAVAELVNADKLKVPTVRLKIGDSGASAGSEELRAALLAATHGADGEANVAGSSATNKKKQASGNAGPLRGSSTAVYHPRPRVCLELGTVEQANATYFALAEFQRGQGGAKSRLAAGGSTSTMADATDAHAESDPAADASTADTGSPGDDRKGDDDTTVESLLSRLGLSQYAEAFAEEEFSLEILRESAGRPDELRATLKELGMKKLGHREKLLSSLL